MLQVWSASVLTWNPSRARVGQPRALVWNPERVFVSQPGLCLAAMNSTDGCLNSRWENFKQRGPMSVRVWMFKTSVPGRALQGHFRRVHYGFTFPVTFRGPWLYLIPIFRSTFSGLPVRIMWREYCMFSRRWPKTGVYSKEIFNILWCVWCGVLLGPLGFWWKLLLVEERMLSLENK